MLQSFKSQLGLWGPDEWLNGGGLDHEGDNGDIASDKSLVEACEA